MKYKRQGVRFTLILGDLASREANSGAGLAQLALKPTPIDKFLYLSTLRKNNVHLFYRLVNDHLRVSWPCRILAKKPLTNITGIDSPDLHSSGG